MNAASAELADNRNIGTSHVPDDNADEKGCCCYRSSKRYLLVGMLFLGAISIQFLHINIYESITKMRNDETISEPKPKDEDIAIIAKQSVEKMYTNGFLTSIIAALIARKFGPVTTYGYALLLAGVVTILNPYIARFNFDIFLAATFLEGSLAMACHVATADILSRWSSKKERFKMVSIVISGTYVDTAISSPVCEYLVRIYGWPSTFYCTGAIAVLISSTILLLFGDDPSQDKGISKNELKLLTREVEDSSNEKIIHLWKKILTAKPLWALLVTKIGLECGWALYNGYLILSALGVWSPALKNIAMVAITVAILTVPVAGLSADYLLNSKILTATKVHKRYIANGFVLGAMCLFVMSLIRDSYVAFVLLLIFRISLSAGQLTTMTLPIYMAPQHSGLIAAIISYGYHIGVYITPTLMYYIDTSHIAYPASVFRAAHGAIFLTVGIIFLLFGSGEILEMFRANPLPENGQNRETRFDFESFQNAETQNSFEGK